MGFFADGYKLMKVLFVVLVIFCNFKALAKTQYCGEVPGSLVKWNIDEFRPKNGISFSFPSQYEEYKILPSASVVYGVEELAFEVVLFPAIDFYHSGYLALKNRRQKKIQVCATYTHGSCSKKACSVYN